MIRIKRLTAQFIDYAIILFLLTCLINCFTKGNNNMIIITIMLLLLILTLFFKDFIFKNASIGKKIFKLEIRHLDDSLPSKKILIKRIIECFPLFPLEIISIMLNNQTSGDKKYKTKVVYKSNKNV